MLSFGTYKVLHLLGVFMILLGLGAAIALSKLSPLVTDKKSLASFRRYAVITHGTGLLVVLVAGFGLLAREGIHWPWPGWVWGKALIWLLLGALVAPIRRKPELARLWWTATLILAGFAAYLAILRPF